VVAPYYLRHVVVVHHVDNSVVHAQPLKLALVVPLRVADVVPTEDCLSLVAHDSLQSVLAIDVNASL
jgi:hypothetical protein